MSQHPSGRASWGSSMAASRVGPFPLRLLGLATQSFPEQTDHERIQPQQALPFHHGYPWCTPWSGESSAKKAWSSSIMDWVERLSLSRNLLLLSLLRNLLQPRKSLMMTT
jgi:hypothetical protein